MPPRSRQPNPLSETPFWRTRGFLWGMLGLAVLLAAGGTVWLVKMNHRQQIQWRLEQDPQLSRLRQSLTKKINAGKPGQPRTPAALWLGRVKKFTVGQPTDGKAPIALLEMSDAILLAGAKGSRDGSDSLTISGTNYVWGGPLPKPGEIWMISVWRDGANNFIDTATRTSLK